MEGRAKIRLADSAEMLAICTLIGMETGAALGSPKKPQQKQIPLQVSDATG